MYRCWIRCAIQNIVLLNLNQAYTASTQQLIPITSLMFKQVKPRRVKAATAKRKQTATAMSAAAADSTSSTTTAVSTNSQYCSVIGMKLAALVKRKQLAVYSNDGSATAGDALTVSQLLLALLQQQQLLPAGVTVDVDFKNGYINFNTLNLQCDDAAALSYYRNSISSSCKTSSSTPISATISSNSAAHDSTRQHEQHRDIATAATVTAVADSSNTSAAMDTNGVDTVHADRADMMHDDNTDNMRIHSDTTTSNTSLQYNGLTGSSSILSAQDRDRLMSIDQCDGSDDIMHVVLNSSASSSANTTVYGLPKHEHKGPHELTVTTIPAQFTQEVYEVMSTNYVHVPCVYYLLLLASHAFMCAYL
jgi:hypothetical protein